jgi:radixin
MQAKYGDFNSDSHKKGALINDRLLPDRVKEQFKLSPEQWEERIVTWWAEHKGMMREDAMMEYLKIAQDLEMYGVNYFEIRNKKGTELWLGVDALGLNIYEKNDRLTPKIGFPWSEIRNISFNDKKFVIKPIVKKAPDFVFYAPRLRINKRILALCMGNHELYMRRRKPDTIEVQQMKAQAREERQVKVAERDKLNREVAAREAAERKQKEYEDRLMEMQDSMQRAQRDLLDAQDTIRRLEQQLRELQEAKQALDDRERELDELTRRMTSEREMEVSEREKLAEEIRRREEEVERIRRHVEEKDEQTRMLQEEVEDARRRQQEAQEALMSATTEAMRHNRMNNVFETVSSEQYGGHGRTHEQHYGKSAEDAEEHYHDDHISTNGDGDNKVELTSDIDANVPQWEMERETQVEKNTDMRARLDELKLELEAEKIPERETNEDILYQQYVSKGQSKYKTLAQIRAGATKRRIDQFENM